MRKIREILRLRASGLTEREVAQSVGCSRTTVQGCLRRTRAAGISWPLPEELDEVALKRGSISQNRRYRRGARTRSPTSPTLRMNSRASM
jgi:hypothetical protein